MRPTSIWRSTQTDGIQSEVLSNGLGAASGLAIGPDDALYVANVGVMPGMGEVLTITGYE